MANKSNFVFISFIVFVLSFITLSLITEGCADSPSSVGIRFINPSETIGVKIFDSYVDTMPISTSNLRIYINTSYSKNFIVGKKTFYSSMGLIKFTNLSSNFDTATVRSATLKLKYRNYYFPVTPADSLGNVAFDIYPVLRNLNYSSITYDSVNFSSYGISQGNYSGSPAHDSSEVDISLNTTLVSNWLKYSHDTGYSVKNYGIVLMPNSGSNVLKSFYSGQASSGLKPVLQITFSSNPDTLTFDQSQTVFLGTGTLSETTQTFSLLGGISFVDVIKFNTYKLSPKIIVNDAQLILTLDSAHSMFSNQSVNTINSYFVADTLLNTESFAYSGALSNNQFNIRLIGPFQRWIQGQNNYGLLLRVYNEFSNLDFLSIYNETANDPSKRPRVIIKYSLRLP